MRKRLAVISFIAFLVIGGVVSASGTYYIGSIVVRDPIMLLQGAASLVTRTMTRPSTSASPAPSIRRSTPPVVATIDTTVETRPQRGEEVRPAAAGQRLAAAAIVAVGGAVGTKTASAARAHSGVTATAPAALGGAVAAGGAAASGSAVSTGARLGEGRAIRPAAREPIRTEAKQRITDRLRAAAATRALVKARAVEKAKATQKARAVVRTRVEEKVRERKLRLEWRGPRLP